MVACEFVDPPVEGRYGLHIQDDVGEVAGLAAQQRNDTFDRDLDIQRRPHVAGVRIKLIQSPSRFDLARFRKLHANHAVIAPRDATPAYRGVKYRVPTPRHNATPTPGGIIAPPEAGASKKLRLG